MSEFQPFPKIPRYFREIVVTEKIDGTNGCIVIDPLYDPNGYPEPTGHSVTAQSRKRIITPEDDNFGFAQWVHDNEDSLFADLGFGRHFGEWWGSGIQRGYGLKNGNRCFSLFNVAKWGTVLFDTPGLTVVPVLRTGLHSEKLIRQALKELDSKGSLAAPGFDKPEGVCIFHKASGHLFKATVEGDEWSKEEVADGTWAAAAQTGR